jgi:hypothetical protein
MIKEFGEIPAPQGFTGTFKPIPEADAAVVAMRQHGDELPVEAIDYLERRQIWADATGQFTSVAPLVTTANKLKWGHVYRVPCVWQKTLLVPIVDCPRHNDKPLLPGGPDEHYHIAFSFITSFQLVLQFGSIKAAFCSDGGPNILTETISCLKWIDRVCCFTDVRPYPPSLRPTWTDIEKFPAEFQEQVREQVLTRKRFEDAYQDERLRQDENGCLRCPHQGAPLNGLAPDENGNVICPLHGLKWNLKTRRLVRQVTSETPPPAPPTRKLSPLEQSRAQMEAKIMRANQLLRGHVKR